MECIISKDESASAVVTPGTRAAPAAMALSKLSGDEQGIILGQLCNTLEPRLAVYFGSASSELRALLTPALRQQLRADHEVAAALCHKMGMHGCKELRETMDVHWLDEGLTATDLTTLGTLGSVLPDLVSLSLGENSGSAGPDGVQRLADVLGAGMLPHLLFLGISDMQVGDAGALALAAALDRGALPRLEDLHLTSVAIGDAALVALAPALRRRPALDILGLFDNPFGDEGLAALVAPPPPPADTLPLPTGGLNKLKELDLDYTQVTDAGCAVLAAALDSGALPTLEELTLVEVPASDAAIDAVSEALARSRARRSKLQALSCLTAAKEKKQTAAKEVALSKLSGDEQGIILGQLCNRLEPRLAIYFSSASSELRVLLTPALLQQLKADHEAATVLCHTMGIASCKELREAYYVELDDSRLSATDLATLGTLGSVLPALKVLTLAESSSSAGPDGVPRLAAGLGAGALPAVTFLALDNMHVGDAGALALAAALGRGALPRLRILHLTNAAIDDTALVALAPALRRLPALKLLYLAGNPLGDYYGVGGLAALVAPLPAGAPPRPAGVLTKLLELNLGDTNITDAGCATLIAALQGGALPALQGIYLSDNPATNAATAAVQEALAKRRE